MTPEENADIRGASPAFYAETGSKGLTIREYLAGQALQGLLAGKTDASYPKVGVPTAPEDAVKWADALLLALEKKGK